MNGTLQKNEDKLLVECANLLFLIIENSIAQHDKTLNTILECNDAKFGNNTEFHFMSFDQMTELFKKARDFIFMGQFLHIYHYNVKHTPEHLPIFWLVGDAHVNRISKMSFKNFDGDKYTYFPVSDKEYTKCGEAIDQKILNQILTKIENQLLAIPQWNYPDNEDIYFQLNSEDFPEKC